MHVPALLAVLMAAALSACVAAAADTTGRYVLKDVEGGFIRLDTQTGAVSHCRPRDGQWMCESLADDREVLQKEIADLERENNDLRKRVAELEGADKPSVELPSDADLDRLMGFFERLMKRVIEFARGLESPPGQET